MKRALLLHALTMTCLLACGEKQPATTPTTPAAQQPVAEEKAPEPAAAAPPEAAAEKEPEKPAWPPMHQGPSVWEGEAVGAWIAALVAQQKKSKQEIRVRVPLVVASDGWGCMCPNHFIGNDPNTHNGGDTWVTLNVSELPKPDRQILFHRGPQSGIGDPGSAPTPDEPFRGAVFIVEGYFPGTRTKVDLRNKQKQPSEWLYKTWDLRVTALLGTPGPDEELFVHSEQPVEATTR